MFTKNPRHLWFIFCIVILTSIGLLYVLGSAPGAQKLPATFADYPGEPLHILNLAVFPEPLIGQVATLHLEFISDYDQPVATVDIDLPEGIQLVKGDLNWKGSLTANQPQTHDISICAEYQDIYRIDVTGYLWTAEGDGLFTVPRVLFLNVTPTHVQVAENYYD